VKTLFQVFPKYARPISKNKLYWGTDKGTVHSYIKIYEWFFSPVREKVERVLEIGIQTGASLQMWREYFPRAEVHGVDIKRCPRKFLPANRKRLVFHKMDGRDVEAVNGAFDDESFDIIIDDGCHRAAVQAAVVCNFWSKLKLGGMYVVEDVSAPSIVLNSLVKVGACAGLFSLEHERPNKEDNNLIVALKHGR